MSTTTTTTAPLGPIAHTLAHLPTPTTLLLAFVVLLPLGLYALYTHLAFSTNTPYIRGLPEPPGAVPFFGHLPLLGGDHPTRFQKWSVENGWAVLQARLGRRRVVVLNTFAAAEWFMKKNAAATIDRPVFETFHGVVSGSQGATIGTSPWDASCKRKRTAVGAFMTRPAIQRSAAPLFDLEIHGLITALLDAASAPSSTSPSSSPSDLSLPTEVDPRPLLLRATLNFTTLLCYASRFASPADPLLADILATAHAVSTFRSTNGNDQDHVSPLLCYVPIPSMRAQTRGWSERRALAKSLSARRDVWLDALLERVRKAVGEGRAVSCIAEGLLRDGDVEGAKLNEAEIRSINVGLVSGGFETLATTAVAGLGFLSSEEGQGVQRKAYEAVMEAYGGNVEEAWEKCLGEEKVEYVVALVREMLRYYCAIQLLPPRQTFKEMEYEGVRIPKGVTVYVNAQAINHDETAYGPDAHVFRPERWLDPDNKFKVPAPYHYSYGAGSRACTAIALSNRILYTMFVRLIIHFKFTASKEAPPTLDYIDFNENRKDASVLPKRFRLKLEEREPREVLERNLEQSKNATSHLVLA
ncbi:cytochrome p450 [Diplodia corticola]|uniref:Cytochrome p450 n=1 Tax=Diplodia corticola TaxID=236234 RepID=A0A1J9QL50_9PEZI|nr:cytochrome p450 [Diplodia corticola]OJD29614.1 cytochrome p450 [Diplodia corticola]